MNRDQARQTREMVYPDVAAGAFTAGPQDCGNKKKLMKNVDGLVILRVMMSLLNNVCYHEKLNLIFSNQIKH